MNKVDLRDLRHLNLMQLIGDRFAGKQADFATAAKKNPTQVNHWISGHRNPNGDTCRDVERELGLPEGWMDRNHNTDINPTVAGQLPEVVQERRQNSTASPPGPANIEQLMAGLAEYLMEMDDYARDNAADVLRRLAANPKEHARAANLFAAAFQSGKRKAA